MKPATIKNFFRLESVGGIILLLATILALLFDNSFLETYYTALRNLSIKFSIGSFSAPVNFMLLINDGLMSLFFLIIGLELKREWTRGVLSDRKKIVLPFFAALGGMLVPAGIYLLFNWHNPSNFSGWVVPVATDIAFALGILSLFGKRIPIELKVFLMLLAIFDDVGAIILIAVFFSGNISLYALFFSGILFVTLILLARKNVSSLIVWLMTGLLLWICFLYLGIHPVVAGVLLGLIMPAKNAAEPSAKLEKILQPWVTFLIMPLFAFMNAGVKLQNFSGHSADTFVMLGIIFGLLIGKPLGVLLTSYCLIKIKFARLPGKTTWQMFFGVASLCGIGFTMSLFLGALAFPSGSESVRLAVLIGSSLSGLLGCFLLSSSIK